MLTGRQSKRQAREQRRRWMRCSSTRVYFATLAALITISRWALLAPVKRASRKRHGHGYRPHAGLSACAACACLALAVAAPYLIRAHTNVYNLSNIETDARFHYVALVSLCSDYGVSLLICAAQTWRRADLARCLNEFAAVVVDLQHFEPHFIDWRCTALLWARIAHFVYGFSMNLPFLVRHSGELRTAELLACLGTLVVEHLSHVFALNMVAALLLFTACYAQLLRCLEAQPMTPKSEELCNVVDMLQSLHQHFVGTFELSIFLLLIGEFINLLANLYGLVYHSVFTASVYPNLIAYNLSLAINLYALVFCAHLCGQQHKRLRHAFLTLPSMDVASDWTYLTQSSRSLVHSHPNWPLDVPLGILGLFRLNHNFWLFLVSYAVNFIVIILQFAVEELANTR